MKKTVFLFLTTLSMTSRCMDQQPSHQHHLHLLDHTVEHIHHMLQIAADIITPKLEEKIEGEYAAIANNPHKNETAHVKKDAGISLQERAYLKKRKPIVRHALYRCLQSNTHYKKSPKIACIFSGGGYRAMLCCLGSLKGLEKEGLLDCITYISALSGSTWALAPWISTQMPLDEYIAYIHQCIEKPLHDITEAEKLLIAEMIAVKKLSHQPLTLVDIYGGLLGHRLLEHMAEKKHVTYLSDQTNIIADGSYPYPIYTVVSGDKQDETSWYSFTPDTITNLTYKLSIPTYGCGRMYKEGNSINNAPELPLSILKGAFGSAFAANWDTIMQAVQDRKPEAKKLIDDLMFMVKPTNIGKGRPIPCELKIHNFTAAMATPISNHKHLQLVDAGTDINLPYPPVSGLCPERCADIMLFFDNSAGPLGKEFKKCVEFASKHKLLFPKINFDDNKIDSNTCSIFMDNNPKVPLVIYMPGISDKNNVAEFDLKKETEQGFCQTQHFQYQKENAHLVTEQTTRNICANITAIKNAITQKIVLMNQ